jgi:LCP family protein required for cell wall assembly
VRNKLFLAVILAVFVLGILTVYFWYREGVGSRALGVQGQAEYVLVLGLDEFGEARRSDTLFVAQIAADGVKILSIPRDLRVKFPDGTIGKINAAYAYGGAKLTRQLISRLLGVDIPWHVVVDYQGFVRFIDALGGVRLTIERPMRYTDTKQNLVIDLPAGTQTLSGKEALDYWRYRDEATGEDLGRIRRQQKFLRALAEKLTEIRGTAQVKALVETMYRDVETNLALLDLYRLAERLQQLSPEDVQFALLPGRPVYEDGLSYFVADPVETAALVEELFHGREVLTNRDVRVIVLNGHPDEQQRQGLARRMSEQLRSRGFQIVAYWNANAFDYSKTYLIDLAEQDAKTQRLMSALSDLNVPVSVVTPEEFTAQTQEAFGEDRLEAIKQLLLTTAVPPDNRGVELTEADFVLILGGDYRQETP